MSWHVEGAPKGLCAGEVLWGGSLVRYRMEPELGRDVAQNFQHGDIPMQNPVSSTWLFKSLERYICQHRGLKHT